MNKYLYALLHDFIIWLFSSVPITLALYITNNPKWLWFLLVPLVCTIYVKGEEANNGYQTH